VVGRSCECGSYTGRTSRAGGGYTAANRDEHAGTVGNFLVLGSSKRRPAAMPKWRDLYLKIENQAMHPLHWLQYSGCTAHTWSI
jgi:hypothetical protein